MRLLIYLSMALFVALFGALTSPIAKYVRLFHVGKTTEARVTGIDRKHHNGIIFHYQIDGKDYEGHSYPDDDFKVGQSATATYLPDTPEVATLENPFWILMNNLLVLGLATVTFPLFVLYRMFPREPKKSNDLPERR